MQAAPPTSRNSTLVTRNGQHVSFGVEFIERFGDMSVPRIDAPDNDSPVCRIRTSLLRDDRGYRMPNAGCIPIFEYLLQKSGNRLDVKESPGIKALPYPRQLDDLGYPSLVCFAHQCKNGVIQVPKKLIPTVIAELTVAYPEQRIIVLRDGKVKLKSIASQVRSLLPSGQSHDVVVVHSKQPIHIVDDDASLPKIIFSTFTSAADCDFETSDIVILLDARNVTRDRCRVALEAPDSRFRLYGMVEPGVAVSPLKFGSIMGTFGPNRISLGTHGRVRNNVAVSWIKHWQPTLDLDRSNADFLCKAYWHNERRNREIIRYARKLLAGDPQQPSFRPSLTILVKHLPHAEALASKLTDWKVYVADEDRYQVNQMKRWFKDRIEADLRTWSSGQNQIVLVSAAKKFPGYRSRGIIWAGGGHQHEIPDSWFYHRDRDQDGNRSTLIVDFDDRFNKETRKWSRERQKSYIENDIYPSGVSATVGRIDAFLARQKEPNHAQ